MNHVTYKVAEHTFQLSFAEGVVNEESLFNYAPFRREKNGEGNIENLLFHLSITEALPECNYHPVGQFDDDIASIGILKSGEGNYRFRIAYPGSADYGTMDVDGSFAEAKVTLPDEERDRYFCLNNCLMLLYAFSAATLDTVLMHASVIKHHNEGFIFLGKSGTGKSTHSRLWMEEIEDSELLNDDNPVVRVINGKPIVFGSPWSGKTPCYKNDSAPLKGIVKLWQAPENKIRKLLLLQAYAAILPACSNMRWEDDLMTGVHQTVEKLAASVACYQLDCLPDGAAAQLCHSTLIGGDF